MPGLTNAAMTVGANAMRTVMTHAQLHSAAAGGSGTSNVTAAGRQAITWGSTSGAGDFDISSPLNFTGGAASGAVYSVTVWSASSGGTFYGEFIIAGDTAFNSSGAYTVTSIALDGSAS